MPKHLYSVHPDPPSWRDHIAAPPAVNLPATVDLSSWLPAVRDQGAEGACTAFAGCGILEWTLKRFHNQDVVLSPQFLYRAERIIAKDITEDNGACARNMMYALAHFGTCLEISDPYVDSGWKQPTTLAQLAEARQYRSSAYHRVNDLATLQAVLNSGYVASLSIEVYDSFESEAVADTGTVPMPNPETEKWLGGHEVYCFGYDNHAKTLLCRNSWGEDWGQQGNFTLPFDYWKFVSDCWMLHLGAPWGEEGQK